MTFHDSDLNSPKFGDGFKKIWAWIKNLMNIKDDAEVEGTIKGIKDGIEFKGTNVWILICSIIMASIGLNINAVGVIIGAMLIAPLMGPILGVGLSVGTNDFTTLKTSVKAFGVMTGIGLFTSWIYFLISPLDGETSELLSRTSPTFLDALVALFGGLAGIVAGSRKEKSNVIPGVAIATALMPPLCTAGYGLAMGNFNYFLGAGYLFILNSVLIALATYLGVRYLHFPKVHQVTDAQESKAKKIIALFAFVVLIPSGFILYSVTQESLFNLRAEEFITEVVTYEGSEIITQKLIYEGEKPIIEVFTIGERIPAETIETWEKQLPAYGLYAELQIFQSKDEEIDMDKYMDDAKAGIMQDLYKAQSDQLHSKDEKIKFLEKELIKYEQAKIPLDKLDKEIRVNYPTVNKFAYSNAIEYTTNSTDTITTFMVNWKGQPQPYKLSSWLEVRLEVDTVRILQY